MEANRRIYNEVIAAKESGHEGLLEWWLDGEVGMSSEVIATVAIGRQPREVFTPSDMGDFRRCEKLLRAVPTLRAELNRVCEVSPEWNRLVVAWPALVAAAEIESPGFFDKLSAAYPTHTGRLLRQVVSGEKVRA